MAKKTFNEKLNDSKNMPVVEIVDNSYANSQGGPKMLIAPPLEYDAIMKKVPKGKLITSDRIRAHLAKKYEAHWTCPLTAGIFINIAANASAERQGQNETPYWRTLKKDGELCEKFPGGIDGHKALLLMEGHQIIQKGKRYFVENYDKHLHKL